MIDFPAIKQRAKDTLNNSYWVLVGLILLAGALGASSGSFGLSFSFNGGMFKKLFSEEVINIIRGILIAGSVISLCYTVFVGNVAAVGLAKLTTRAYRGEDFFILDLFHGFRDGRYWRVVGTMALMTLFVLLGCMLFVVPGIIIALGLFPLPYVLAENDELSGMDALRRAWEISNGHKANYFLFCLTFIGWFILNALTCGVLGVFFVNPYFELSKAGYYTELTHPALVYEDNRY